MGGNREENRGFGLVSYPRERMKREREQLGSIAGTSSCGYSSGKSNLWEEEGGMDELLAVVGYKVRSSDMAEVAQKLERLEEAMGNVQDDLPEISNDVVHYNPSDISNWLETKYQSFII